MTFEELRQQVALFAAAMRKMGVKKGDRVVGECFRETSRPRQREGPGCASPGASPWALSCVCQAGGEPGGLIAGQPSGARPCRPVSVAGPAGSPAQRLPRKPRAHGLSRPPCRVPAQQRARRGGHAGRSEHRRHLERHIPRLRGERESGSPWREGPWAHVCRGVQAGPQGPLCGHASRLGPAGSTREVREAGTGSLGASAQRGGEASGREGSVGFRAGQAGSAAPWGRR